MAKKPPIKTTVHPTRKQNVPAAATAQRGAPARGPQPARQVPQRPAPPQRQAPAPQRAAPNPPPQQRAVNNPQGAGARQPLQRPGQRQPLQRPGAATRTAEPPADRWRDDPTQGDQPQPETQAPTEEAQPEATQAELQLPAAARPGPRGNAQRAMDANRGAPQRAVAVRGNGGAVAQFEPGDTGFETMDSEDLLIPRMVILQDLSPQVKPQRSEYIEGAVPGMIYDTATGVLLGPWNTDEEWNNNPPLIVIPAYFERRGLEWLPDRQGLVRDWGTDESYRRIYQKEGMMWISPDGNRVQPTLTFYCVSITEEGLRCFIPMSSVFAKHGKRWNSVMSSYRVPGTRSEGKLWSRGWQLRTSPQQNDQGDWMGWQIDPDLTFEEYDQDLQNAVASFRNTMKSGAGAATSQFVEDYQDSQGIADNAGVGAGQM